MDPENMFLNRSELNVEKLMKEKKLTRVIMFLAAIGVLAGLSATLVFFFHYKLAITPGFALLSSRTNYSNSFLFNTQLICTIFIAFMAFFCIYIHVQFLRDYWQIWTYQLKYWYITSVIVQATFVLCFVVFIGLAIYNKQCKLNNFYD